MSDLTFLVWLVLVLQTFTLAILLAMNWQKVRGKFQLRFTKIRR